MGGGGGGDTRRVSTLPHIVARPLPGLQISLCQQLGVGVFHRHHSDAQMGGQSPLGGQLIPRRQPAGQDILLMQR